MGGEVRATIALCTGGRSGSDCVDSNLPCVAAVFFRTSDSEAFMLHAVGAHDAYVRVGDHPNVGELAGGSRNVCDVIGANRSRRMLWMDRREEFEVAHPFCVRDRQSQCSIGENGS